jgi:hypothetical protein
VNTTWNGLPISVSAHLVARFAWQTASIDLTVGDDVVLRTGGAFKLTGKVVGPFMVNGVPHEATLECGLARSRSFPYKVTLDGDLVQDGWVGIENWWIGL